MPSKEMYYKDDNDEPADSAVHSPILDNEPADERTRAMSLENGRARGIPETHLALLFL